MEKVRIKRLHEWVKTPKAVSVGSAGYDVYPHSVTKLKYGRQVVPLGFSVELPSDMMMYVQPKSGMSLKGLKAHREDGREVRLDADVMLGLVDSDYRGEVGVLVNVHDPVGAFGDANIGIYLYPDDSIAQLTFHRVPEVGFEECDELSVTERGEQGFGKMDNQ